MDAYSQRLSELGSKKKDNFGKKMTTHLGIKRPNMPEESKVLPLDPNAKQEAPVGSFQHMFDNYAKDDQVKADFEELTALISTLKKEYEGINLPEDFVQEKMTDIVNRFRKQSSDRRNMNGGGNNGIPTL